MRICNICDEIIEDLIAIRDVKGFICLNCGQDLDENGNFPEELQGDIDDSLERIKTRN